MIFEFDMKTYMAKPKEIERKWYLVDAQNKVLGRLATEVANILRGKHKPTYTPHLDTGDFVVVINASKIRLTGNKLEDKVKYRHTGYPGGIKATNFEKIVATKPEMAIHEAVRGMLPHNKLSRAQLKKLKVYSDNEHPHEAQKLEKLEIKG